MSDNPPNPSTPVVILPIHEFQALLDGVSAVLSTTRALASTLDRVSRMAAVRQVPTQAPGAAPAAPEAPGAPVSLDERKARDAAARAALQGEEATCTA
jgi:hypothetical protein